MINVGAMKSVENNYRKLTSPNYSETVKTSEVSNATSRKGKKSDEIQIENFKVSSIAKPYHKLILNSALIGGLSYLGMTNIIDSIIFDLLPGLYDIDDNRKKLKPYGRAIKIIIIIIIYVIVELYIIPS
jgi:hypothetical protein